MSKLRTGLVSVNQPYGPNIYLPYSVGLLQAYAVRFPEVADNWSDPVYLYRKEPIADALEKLGDPLPDLLCFSTYCWNFKWNLALAEAAKLKNPRIITLFGGVHVPDDPDVAFWAEHPQIDFLLRGEGEHAFSVFLKEFPAGNPDWSKVPNLSWREGRTKREFPKMEDLRSPYLDGTFAALLPREPRFHVLTETNRGCPY